MLTYFCLIINFPILGKHLRISLLLLQSLILQCLLFASSILSIQQGSKITWKILSSLLLKKLKSCNRDTQKLSYRTLWCLIKDINHKTLIATGRRIPPMCPKLYEELYTYYFIYYFWQSYALPIIYSVQGKN